MPIVAPATRTSDVPAEPHHVVNTFEAPASTDSNRPLALGVA